VEAVELPLAQGEMSLFHIKVGRRARAAVSFSNCRWLP
jgi:hypothetical protein